MSKSLKRNESVSREMQDSQFEQIIGTARSIIDKYADDGYPRGERRHPIFGYINFLVRRFIYNDVFDDISKDGCRRLSNYSIVNMNNWILKFSPNVYDVEEKFGRTVFLNNATDPLISSYDTRCRIIDSFTEPGYVDEVNSDAEGPGIILMLPFGVGFTSSDCHTPLSLNLRGEYRSRIRQVYDYSDVVRQWEYRNGLLVNSITDKDESVEGNFPDFIAHLMGILFAIGRMMVENGIEWKEYTVPDND